MKKQHIVLALALALIAVGVVLGLSSFFAPKQSPSADPSPSVQTSSTVPTPTPTPTPTESATPTPSPTESTSPSQTPSPSKSASTDSPYGPTSRQCKAMSRLLLGASRLGLMANAGTTVTQADVDLAFANQRGVPDEFKIVVRRMKAVSQELVGKSADEVLVIAPRFSAAIGDMQKATQAVCK